MTTIRQQPPCFSETEARSSAGDLFGVTGTARPLPSERDQNFLLETDSGPEFVLKVSNSSESRANLEAQNQVLEYLAHKAPSLRCPRVMATTQGEHIGQRKRSDGSTHLVRLLSYVPGHLLVDVSPHTPELLHSFGLFFARLDQALASFSHPALKRELQWDLARARQVVGQQLVHIEDRERRSLVTHFHQRFQELAEPALPSLRLSVIHNDGNDYNVLVTGLPTLGGEVTGVLDFGDMVSSCTVFELAVCAAYAILDKADPVAAAADVVGGYHSANPLTELELRLLYDLIAMRLCTSVTMSASQQKCHPENAYLTVSEVPAWAALERLARVNPRYAHYAFRAACGLPACPRSAPVVQWLSDNPGAIGPVASPDVRRGNYVTFDLAAGSSELVGIEDPTDPNLLAEALFGRMRTEGASVGVGRYDEARRSYTTEHYRPLGSEVEDWRTVHLGIDLFLKPGSPVFAPLEGAVHSFRNNAQAQDYGPTIILRHEVEGIGEFYTLYGHLREQSLDGVSVGMQITKGRQIGAIGESSVNGFWPPHLHFQLITDVLDYSGDFPGVCADRDRAVWLSISPDPNLILS
ncbi:MAG: phosphotransferase, partial [Nitrospiraceae bacterium]